MLHLDEVPCPVLVTDGSGLILALNSSALKVAGGSEEKWTGEPLDSLLPLPSRMFLQTHVWPMLLHEGCVSEVHLQLLDTQRQRLPVMVNCRRGHFAEAVAYFWVFFVATERSRFEAELLDARKRADAAAATVAESERFVKTITNAVPGLVGCWDKELRCRFANIGYLEWFGRPHAEVIGAHLRDLMDEHTLRACEPRIQAVLAGNPQRFERSQPGADGRQSQALVSYIPDFDPAGRVIGFFELVIDITQLKEAEGELRLAASVVENTAEAIMVTDEFDVILSVNPAFTATTGYHAAESVGRPSSLLDAGRHDDAFHAAVKQELSARGRWKGETWARKHDGSIVLLWQAITAISAGPTAPLRLVSVFSDITERWRNDERLRHLAFHDPLTDLPNRSLLLERLGQLIDQTEREPRQVAVLFLDLDRFKAINDTLGHDVGDQLLKAVARVLQGTVRQSDTVARLGGDEFVVILDNPDSAAQVESIAKRIIGAVGEARVLEAHSVEIGVSVGIAVFPHDGRTPETLISHADTALYAAKGAGRNGYRFFGDA
jgi:diguanylate cyclase (GGDEF)-like protein/PAS domain S-box-containing protein